MSAYSAYTEIATSASPNDGRTIINNSFEYIYSALGGSEITGDTYWASGSTGINSIKADNDSGLDATGNYATAIGYGTLASGDYSHAGGYSSVASGTYSAVIGGQSCNAQSEGTIILGCSGITGTSSYTTYVNNLNIQDTYTSNFETTHYADVTVTQADLYSAATNPITVLSDPGINKINVITKIISTFNVTVPYDYSGFPGDYSFYLEDYKLATIGNLYTTINPAYSNSLSGLTIYNDNQAGYNTAAINASGDTTIRGLDFNGDPNNPDSGAGDLRYRIWYKTISL